MKNLLVRALSGAVYVALIVLCVFISPFAFWALISLFAAFALSELHKILAKLELSNRITVWLDFALFAAVFISIIIPALARLDYKVCPIHFMIGGMLALLPMMLYIPARIVCSVADRSDRPLKSTLASSFVVMYVIVPLAMIAITGAISPKLMFFTFLLIWINDTFAYLSGILLGRHKLCERLSPKKTWEGFFGGFIMCVIAGALIGQWDNGMWVQAGVYAAIVSVFGTFGDLFESLIKRSAGVKDSGSIMPGHGGILDRLDSIIAVAPFSLIAAFYL